MKLFTIHQEYQQNTRTELFKLCLTMLPLFKTVLKLVFRNTLLNFQFTFELITFITRLIYERSQKSQIDKSGANGGWFDFAFCFLSKTERSIIGSCVR